ncbi:hypothetical protein FHS57_004759 [Runella defluvii]|uniref:Uncharacterized protein n=1 Tax=Runella defluvii TaxID=370973 RepID=A0A7W5ZSA4_9BACT|nr:hypothetical protein [Runella defluvii]MBB3840739.1 hypothetical protein [Runella defluvii]
MKGVYKFIVLAFDNRSAFKTIKEFPRSDGMIFDDEDAAYRYIQQSLTDDWATQFIVCRFFAEDIHNESPIQLHKVKSVGFKEKKVSRQLNLFDV